MTKTEIKKSNYTAHSIQVLEGLEPVRKRPGMYIGSTGPDGLHHLIWEIFDNSRDEAMGGFANRIEISLLPEDYIRVVDNGRGIPTDIHPKTKVSALETIMTTLHAGGKFGGEGYQVSGGLHGVGASVVNALSIFTKVEVHRDGKIFVQEYSKGVAKAKVKEIGKTKFTGTIVTFKPDAEIFKEGIKYEWSRIISHLRQQAYLVKGLQIDILDLRNKYIETEISNIKSFLNSLEEITYLKDLDQKILSGHKSLTFFFEGGLRSLVAHYNLYAKPIHKNIFYIEKNIDEQTEKVGVEIALQYVDDLSTKILAFANNIPNSEGGTHVSGFKTALTRLLNSYARKNNILKEKDENLTGEDVLEGLTAVVSVKLREIQFEGQTKAKLGSMEAQTAVSTVFSNAFAFFLEEHPDDAKEIISKGILALRARKAAKAAKDSVFRKGALGGLTLPGKLADCQSNSAEESELFIVEGDSAGGSAKMGRDRKIQAILPLRGKILNVERARLDKMLGSEQIRNLVLALGTAIGDTFDLKNIRYHKIIIATDADVDGEHIRTLLLTFFFRYYKAIIDSGFIYIAQPPLFKITEGKKVSYAYTSNEVSKFNLDLTDINENSESESENETENNENLNTEKPSSAKAMAGQSKKEKELEKEKEISSKKSKVRIQRYKGLGEMNAEELWETTMDPKNRILKQVSARDAEEAGRIFEMLMGSEVGPRKSFIQTYAKEAEIDA